MLRPRVYGDTRGLKLSLRRKLGRMAKRIGRNTRIFVRSGFRTREEQTILWSRYLRYGWPLAARPGTSRHESGRAADISVSVKGRLYTPTLRHQQHAHAEGLHFPVRGEPWHVEER